MDAEKRVPIKLRPVARKHAGKITEPYRIMERLLAECDEFEPIREAKIRMYWRKDWRADVDGVIVGAQCAKASDRERLLAEEHGESVDLIILLPEKAWDTLDDTEKEHRLYHELCHFAPALDSNGDQKQDEKDRPQWRLKRHPIVAFPIEVRRYGVDRILDHNGRMLIAAETCDMPLFNAGIPAPTGSWRARTVEEALELPVSAAKALERKGVETVGELADLVNRDLWWMDVPGVGKAAAEKVADAFAGFWAANPQYAEAG